MNWLTDGQVAMLTMVIQTAITFMCGTAFGIFLANDNRRMKH